MEDEPEEVTPPPEPKAGDTIQIDGYHEAMKFKVVRVNGNQVCATDTQYNMEVKCDKDKATVIDVKNNINIDKSGE